MLSTVEVQRAIQRIKNNRAPGEDSIVAVLIKNGVEPVVTALNGTIKEVWAKEKDDEILENWNHIPDQ